MNLDTFLANCQTQIGYTFQDPELLRTALTHSSGADTPQHSNERMEFLGDAVLGYVMCNYLFDTFPTMLEGDMTKIKSSVVSRSTCQQICKEIGLDKFLILGRGLGRINRVPDSIYANTMESFIASIYLDGGLDEARNFILRVFRNEIERLLKDHDADNFKSLLQHHSQKYLGHTPEYKVIEITGPEHHKAFHVGVKVGAREFPSAWGATKKIAEQRAAENALAVLEGNPIPYLH
jgi:ribonuclease-3